MKNFMKTSSNRNNKPEKIVENNVIWWLQRNGFSVDVYDSKATFSVASQRYKKSKNMKIGTPDLLGVSPEGFFVAIELKAPGKEEVCSFLQRQFLVDKIERNGFGLVVSDISFLQETWLTWLNLRKSSKDDEAKKLLKSLLPKKVLLNKRIVNIET